MTSTATSTLITVKMPDRLLGEIDKQVYLRKLKRERRVSRGGIVIEIVAAALARAHAEDESTTILNPVARTGPTNAPAGSLPLTCRAAG